MHDEALVKKLRLNPSQRNLILNASANYLNRLGDLPYEAEADLNEGEGRYDFVHLFVQDQAELNQWAPIALQAVKYDGLLWMSYPKGTAKVKTDLNRDKGWGKVTAAGLTGIAQVSVDDTWSATRFRPVEMVRKNQTSKS